MSLKQHAKEILDLIDRGVYSANGVDVSIEAQIQSSLDGSRLYNPEQLATLRRQLPTGEHPAVEVVNGTTQNIAREMSDSGPLVLLNFASARNPGGGFLSGAKAQEEDLCRCSALYPTLTQHQEYYDSNRNQSSLLYTDNAIFSPSVPFFKTRGTGDYLAKPFLASVITAPAPNTKPYLAKSGDAGSLTLCFERRWKNILAIAYDVGIRNVLLGAWGCGAFGGDPAIASKTAKNALADFGPAFDRVVFAIPGKGKQSKRNLQIFADTFGATP